MHLATIFSVLPLALLSGVYAIPFASPQEAKAAASCRPTSWSNDHAPSTGTLRAAVVFVDFPDAEAETSVKELYDPIASDPAKLYNTMSYGKLKLELVPFLDKFYRMPEASSSYDFQQLTTENHVRYLNDALKAVGKSKSYADIDVLYVIATKNAEQIPGSAQTSAPVTAPDGTVITASITFGHDLYFGWGWKSINHETGHAMGLPDLYPLGGGANEQYVGHFDLMGVIGGEQPDYFAWHKWQLGWIGDEQVECVGSAGKSTHRIGPIEVAGNSSKAVAVPLTNTQYLMVEVRSSLGIDTEACGTGVLLYTTDTALESGEGPVRVIDSKPNSDGCAGVAFNDAPLGVGESFDTELGVVVKVVSQDGDDYTVEVDYRK